MSLGPPLVRLEALSQLSAVLAALAQNRAFRWRNGPVASKVMRSVAHE
jgi:hypothetical protein